MMWSMALSLREIAHFYAQSGNPQSAPGVIPSGTFACTVHIPQQFDFEVGTDRLDFPDRKTRMIHQVIPTKTDKQMIKGRAYL